MKRLLIGITCLIILCLIWVTFIGIKDGVESSSSGNYFTPVDKSDVAHISGQEFMINLAEDLQLLGKIRETHFPDRIAITLKISGTRNRSLYFGATPLPSKENIASVVADELIRLGLKSGVNLAIITLPLDQDQQTDNQMKPIKL